jgi:hypothetical protein
MVFLKLFVELLLKQCAVNPHAPRAKESGLVGVSAYGIRASSSTRIAQVGVVGNALA